MHEEYSRIYPELSHLPEQRLMYQKRAILINKRISQIDLNILKAEVAAEINIINTENLNRCLLKSPRANDTSILAAN